MSSKRCWLLLAALLLLSPLTSWAADPTCETLLAECRERLEDSVIARMQLISVIEEQSDLIKEQRSLTNEQIKFSQTLLTQLNERDEALNLIESSLRELRTTRISELIKVGAATFFFGVVTGAVTLAVVR